MAKKILIKNTVSGKIETIDSTEIIDYDLSKTSVEMITTKTGKLVNKEGVWVEDDSESMGYMNETCNIKGIKLGLKFDNLPDVSTIHIEILRYKQGKRFKPYPSPTQNPLYPLVSVPSGYKSNRNDRKSEMMYGLDSNDAIIEIGHLKDIRPVIHQVDLLDKGIQTFNFGVEHYFRGAWDREKVITPGPLGEFIHQSMTGFPMIRGGRSNSATNYGIELKYTDISFKTKNPDLQLEDIEHIGYDVLLQKIKKITRVKFAMRLIINKDLDSEFTSPNILYFNAKALYTKGLGFGEINIYPS